MVQNYKDHAIFESIGFNVVSKISKNKNKEIVSQYKQHNDMPKIARRSSKGKFYGNYVITF